MNEKVIHSYEKVNQKREIKFFHLRSYFKKIEFENL